MSRHNLYKRRNFTTFPNTDAAFSLFKREACIHNECSSEVPASKNAMRMGFIYADVRVDKCLMAEKKYRKTNGEPNAMRSNVAPCPV